MTDSRSNANETRTPRTASIRSLWRGAGRPAVLALALAALAVPLAVAQGPHGPGGHGGRHGGPGGPHGGPHGEMHGGDLGVMFDHLADRLELTEAQRTAAHQVLEDRQDEVRAAMESVRQQHDALREAAQAEPVNEGAIRAAGEALGTASADAAVLRAELHQELMAILTPEQRAELEALHAERETRREERRERWQERRERRRGEAPDA